MARAATPAIAALLAAEVPHEVLRYRHDPFNESFGEEAVDELAAVEGVDPEQVYKTLIIALPKGLAVAVLPVPSKLSLKAAATALGVPKAKMADRVSPNAPPAMSSAASPRSASASRCRPSSTPPRCIGIVCCAVPASAAGMSRCTRRI